MAVNLYSFHHWLVGPYSVHWDGFGGLIVARRVNTSSHSSDVLSVLGDASYVRFNSWEEHHWDHGSWPSEVSSLESTYEYVKLCDLGVAPYHSNDSAPVLVAEMFYAVVKVFGGYNEFVSEVYRDGGGDEPVVHFDEDGLDYDRVKNYGIRLKIVDEVALRLIRSEGYSIW